MEATEELAETDAADGVSLNSFDATSNAKVDETEMGFLRDDLVVVAVVDVVVVVVVDIVDDGISEEDAAAAVEASITNAVDSVSVRVASFASALGDEPVADVVPARVAIVTAVVIDGLVVAVVVSIAASVVNAVAGLVDVVFSVVGDFEVFEPVLS